MSLRFFAPTLTHRMFDPMPLPRRSGRRIPLRRRVARTTKSVLKAPVIFSGVMAIKQVPLGR